MTLVLRIGLAILAVNELVIGAWNQFWPEHFYEHFPTVSLTPPFAEHFARDFGGATLGLGVVLACAAALPRTVLVVPALLGMSAFAIPHAIFHATHLHGVSATDAAFLTGSTVGIAVLGPALLVVAWLRWRRERNAATSRR